MLYWQISDLWRSCHRVTRGGWGGGGEGGGWRGGGGVGGGGGGWWGGGEGKGSQNLCTIVMTHNDLCTCITLTKWDGPVVCVNVTENVENFQSKCYHFAATKTSVTVSVKQYEHDRVTHCTFSVDFKEIKTISQSLPSTCAICLQPRQSGRHREEIGTHRLSGTMNFRIRI